MRKIFFKIFKPTKYEKIRKQFSANIFLHAKHTLNSHKYLRHEVNTILRWEKHFIGFIDDITRYYYIYLRNSKDKAIEFKKYKNEVEMQLNKKIKMIRSDSGSEYESTFEEICLEYDIIHQTTAFTHRI